jgi:hypothetical protein
MGRCGQKISNELDVCVERLLWRAPLGVPRRHSCRRRCFQRPGQASRRVSTRHARMRTPHHCQDLRRTTLGGKDNDSFVYSADRRDVSARRFREHRVGAAHLQQGNRPHLPGELPELSPPRRYRRLLAHGLREHPALGSRHPAAGVAESDAAVEAIAGQRRFSRSPHSRPAGYRHHQRLGQRRCARRRSRGPSRATSIQRRMGAGSTRPHLANVEALFRAGLRSRHLSMLQPADECARRHLCQRVPSHARRSKRRSSRRHV